MGVDVLEVIAGLEKRSADDYLTPGEYSEFAVGEVEKLEDLEGDGDRMAQKVTEQISTIVDDLKEKGVLEAGGGPVYMQLALRDPTEGDHTLFLQSELSLDQDGNVNIHSQPCVASISEAEFEQGGREALPGFAAQIMDNFDKRYSPESNDEFVRTNESEYTSTIMVGPGV